LKTLSLGEGLGSVVIRSVRCGVVDLPSGRFGLWVDFGVDGEFAREWDDLWLRLESSVQLALYLLSILECKYGRFVLRGNLTELCYWKGLLRKREVCVTEEPLLENLRKAVTAIRKYRDKLNELRDKVIREGWKEFCGVGVFGE